MNQGYQFKGAAAKYQLLEDLIKLIDQRPNVVSMNDFGKKGFLSLTDFEALCKIATRQPDLFVIADLYREILTKYYKLDEKAIRDTHQRYYQKPKIEVIASNARPVQQIYSLLTKALRVRELTVNDVFTRFDADDNQTWDENEIREFLTKYDPSISEEEINLVKKDLFTGQGNFAITRLQLMRALQDGATQQNTRKIEERSPIHIQAPVLNEPQNNYKPKPSPQRQEPQTKAQQKPTISLKRPSQQVGYVNPILESNIYEDRNQLLSSDIDFKEFVSMEQSTPGIKEFIAQFVQLKRSNQQFTDKQFPASNQSLGYELQNPNIQWKRPSQLWGSNFCIFQKDIDSSRNGLGKWIAPQDIQQGELGDCYFLSALSSIACRYPDLVMQLFVTQKLNPCGMYCVRLFVNGTWKAVVLDDQIPTKQNKPVFSSSTNQELWVILLEKAWAKVFGNYSQIISGNPREVINALTGCPTLVLQTADKDFDHQFESYINRQFILTSGSLAEGQQGMYVSSFERKGLVPEHAYSILRVKEIEHKQRGKIKILKLRNPWAQKEWAGDWSDQSPLWTPELKQQLKVKNKNDGTFYMQLSDFKNYFSNVEVGLYHQGFVLESQSFVSNRKHALYFSFTIKPEHEGQYYISVIQKGERLLRQKYSNYKYSTARILLAREVSPGSYQYIGSANKADAEVWIGELLPPGRYVLYTKVEWVFWEENDFVISAYGESPIKLKQIQKVPNLLNSVYEKKGRENPNKTPYKGIPQLYKSSSFVIQEGFGYYYFNNDTNKPLETQLCLRQMQGLKFRKPDRNNVVKLKLQPGQNYCAVLTIKSNGFALSMEESYLY